MTRSTPLDRALRVFGDVRAGEGLGIVLLFSNILVLLVAYYILKTVREPLILAQGGAELRSYAAAAQAVLLIGYVPLYSWVATTLPADKLILTVVLFFAACIEIFVLAGRSGVPYLGFAFFVWLGIFSLTTIAQFWSFANDLYRREDGERLFPLIAIGATVGAPIGSALAERFFAYGVDVYSLMQAAALLLVVQLGLYRLMQRGRQRAPGSVRPERRPHSSGFGLVLRSRYLLLIALLLIVLNVVSTTGDYIMTRNVVHAAELRAADPGFDRDAFIGAFYGRYQFWVSIIAVIIQAFVVSRLVKRFGLAGALFVHPLVALGAYGTAAAGAGLSISRWAKSADSAVDYSATNTAKQMLWLPTSREEKYQAKQAIDTFFVRFGDMIAAGVVFVGTQWLLLGSTGFAISNLLFIAGWLVIATLLLRQYRRLATEREAARAA